jgi:hypothetical protein
VTSAGNSLRLVKVAHTIVWAILAACIVAIPALAWLGYDLPEWLARHDKLIFGSIYLGGIAVTFARCM